MKTITLSKGKTAIVDNADFEMLSQFKWYALKRETNWYAVRNVTVGVHKQKKLYMHNVVCPPPEGYTVDHINRDSLDNRRTNLRPATSRQQDFNTGPRGRNKYKGVERLIGKNGRVRWSARIFIGSFDTATEAAKAWDLAARRIHGEFAYQNLAGSPDCGQVRA